MRRLIYTILLPFSLVIGTTAQNPEGAEEALVTVYTDADTTYFATFEDALKEANKKPEATMRLSGDVTFGGQARQQLVKTHLTLDLNGYSLGDTLSSEANTTALLMLNNDTVSLRVMNGTLWAHRAYNSRIYVVNCSKGTAVMTNVHIAASNPAEDAPNASIWCVHAGTKGVVELRDCTIEAVSSVAATGIFGSGDKTSVSQLDIARCTIRIRANRNAYAISSHCTVSITDCDLDVQTDSTNAYGVNLNPTDTALHIHPEAVVSRTRIRVSAGLRSYGILNKGGLLVMEDDTVRVESALNDAYAYHSYYDHVRCRSVRCLLDAETGTTNAIGAFIQKGNMNAEDCLFRGVCRQDTATVPGNSNARAMTVSNNTVTALKRCVLRAQGTQPLFAKSVYALSGNASATLTIEDCTLEAQGVEDVKGMNCPGSTGSAMLLDMRRCRIQAKGARNVHGLTCYSTSEIADSRIEISATESTAYGIYVNNYRDTTLRQDIRAYVNDCKIDVRAGNKAYGLFVYGPLDLTRDTVTAVTEKESCKALQASRDTTWFRAKECLFRAEAGYHTAYGADVTKGYWSSEDCVYDVTARQDTAHTQPSEAYVRGVTVPANGIAILRRCTIQVRGTNGTMAKGVTGISGNSSARLEMANCRVEASGTESTSGITAGSRMVLQDCSIEALSSGATVYGLNINNFNDTTLKQDIAAELTRTRIHAKAQTKNYTLFCKSPAVLKQDTIEGESGTKTFASYLYKPTFLDSCFITARATESEAYGFYLNSDCDTVCVRECAVKASAPEKVYILNRNQRLDGKVAFYGGYYSHNENLPYCLPEGYNLYRLYDGAWYEAGYRYTVRPIDDPQAVVARMYDSGTGTHLGDFTRVAEALDYVRWHDTYHYSIVVTAACRLAAGTYYVPYYAALVVACEENQKTEIGTSARRGGRGSTRQEAARLEVMDGVELMVEGALEVSGVQQGGETSCGTLSGETGYGHMVLAPGAKIELLSGSRLQAWGYITGQGLITARAGSSVREFFQIGDWKGGTVSLAMMNNPQKVFPINHFFYQNIESPIEYQAGSFAYGSTYVVTSMVSVPCDNIRIVHTSDALFEMSGTDPQSAIRKAYDPQTDRIHWTTQGDVTLDKLGIALSSGYINLSMYSDKYVLPIGTNTTLHARSGTLHVLRDAVMLPSSQMEIHENAHVHIPRTAHLYVMDEAEWINYKNERYTTIPFSPSWKECPRDTVVVPARIAVSGSVQVEGALYTTAGGADIIGIDSVAGEIRFINGAADEGVVYQMIGDYDNHSYLGQPVQSASLRNADGSLTGTTGALPGDVFAYKEGRWSNGKETGLGTPGTETHGRVRLEGQTVVIESPDGTRYSILGQKW